MTYELEIRDKAQRDFDAIPPKDAARISKRIAALTHDLQGDVKRLTHVHPDYRLRVGDWRVLFEVAGPTVIIHRVLHRREAYRQ
jgi:mRNA interferase RelE/StbE